MCPRVLILAVATVLFPEGGGGGGWRERKSHQGLTWACCKLTPFFSIHTYHIRFTHPSLRFVPLTHIYTHMYTFIHNGICLTRSIIVHVNSYSGQRVMKAPHISCPLLLYAHLSHDQLGPPPTPIACGRHKLFNPFSKQGPPPRSSGPCDLTIGCYSWSALGQVFPVPS